MIWLIGYLTIALLVGTIAAFFGQRENGYREDELWLDAVFGMLIGILWPMTVPLAAFLFTIWYLTRKLLLLLGIREKDSHLYGYGYIPPPPPRHTPPPRR